MREREEVFNSHNLSTDLTLPTPDHNLSFDSRFVISEPETLSSGPHLCVPLASFPHWRRKKTYIVVVPPEIAEASDDEEGNDNVLIDDILPNDTSRKVVHVKVSREIQH
ncbi:hypothetical protein NPIL_404041 [Nephila pilipes]|uniref:Uncharacterized protein n=1 Tax=Nephila pilipes TaxID=299642 RepID=A0A8X6NMD3_NEPPI|nr:hypothetical protein NPIL_404041 [Nephila pilipes]